MDKSRGHCNSTSYIVRQVSPQCITAEISCGKYSGNILFIPCIPLSPTDAGLPFTLRRRQFPVRPVFAMTINKAERQTLQRSGVLLDEPVLPTDSCIVALWGSQQHQSFVQNSLMSLRGSVRGKPPIRLIMSSLLFRHQYLKRYRET